MDDDGTPTVFDAIHDELDAIPSETWSDTEAHLVLAALTRIRRARNALPDICFTAPSLRRRRFGVAG